jgi:hypothetical protein
MDQDQIRHSTAEKLVQFSLGGQGCSGAGMGIRIHARG